MAMIVVIEDNPQNARLVSKLLVGAKHSVRICETGEEGIQAALEAKPDLLLIDLGLPDIDGQTVIAVLRQKPAVAGCPLIAFTSWPESTAHSMAKAYGCDGVITKPIDTRKFVSQIEAYLPVKEVPAEVPVGIPATDSAREASHPAPQSIPTPILGSINGTTKRADQ